MSLPPNVWIIAIFVVAMVVRLIIKDRIAFKMFSKALEGSKPAERPKIIQALRGLIGRDLPPRPPDDEERP